MSQTLSNGEFYIIGDCLILKLSPIIATFVINSSTDSVTGLDTNRTIDKQFRYSTDNVNYNVYQALTDGNLSAISLDPTQVYYFEIKYTRTGSDATGVIFWNGICLNMTAVPKNILRINKDNYDAIFGTDRWNEIQVKLQQFNLWSIKKFGEVIYTVDDPSVPHLQQLITILTAQNNFEFNKELISKSFK